MKLYTAQQLADEFQLSKQALLDRSRVLKLEPKKQCNTFYFTHKQRILLFNFRKRKEKFVEIQEPTGYGINVIHHSQTWWIIESKINYL